MSSLPSLLFNLLSHLVFFFSHLERTKSNNRIFVLWSKLSGLESTLLAVIGKISCA